MMHSTDLRVPSGIMILCLDTLHLSFNNLRMRDNDLITTSSMDIAICGTSTILLRTKCMAGGAAVPARALSIDGGSAELQRLFC